MKHFLGSCQQNRHLRQRQTERETGRERGREREGTTLRSCNVETGSPGGTQCSCAGHALGARPGCQGAACTGQRRAGLGSPCVPRGASPGAHQPGAGAHQPGAGAQSLPGSPTLVVGRTRGLHAALWPHSTHSRPGAAVGAPQSRTLVPVVHTVKAVVWYTLKAPATHKTHTTCLHHGINLCNFWTDS